MRKIKHLPIYISIAIVLLISITIILMSRIKKGDIDENVDIDLTVYSTTMAYSTLDNMMSDYEKYNGQTIKISGNIEASSHYYYIEKFDNTGCCSIQLPVLMENLKIGSTVTIIGTFDNGTLTDCKQI